MKKALLMLSLVAILSTSLAALSLTLETECCTYLGNEEDSYYKDTLSGLCPQYNLTEEKCEPILEGWELLQKEFAGSANKGLETCYDEDGVNYPCNDPNLCYDTTGMVVDCGDYPRGSIIYPDKDGIIITLAFVLIIAISIIIWLTIKKKKRNKL